MIERIAEMQESETKVAPPLVSVIIVYYKRRETILDCLNSVFHQDYTNREVILVDNHSEDDLRTVVEAYLPEINLIELPGNLGACAARNAATRASRGKILIFLDDDAGFTTPHEISKIVELFGQRPNIHVLAFQVCDPETGALRPREWCHPQPLEKFSQSEFETNWFGEGACAFRREVFDIVGLYYEPLFYGPEGDDLVVRLLDKGFRILHSPQIRVWHRASENARSLDRQYYYFTRDYVWMAYKDYHLVDGVRYLVPKMLMMTYFTLRARTFGAFFRGLRDGLAGLSRIRPDRTPASKETIRYLAELERYRPGWMKRLRRHREKPQI